MKVCVGDIVRGNDRYGITHSGSTLRVVALFERGMIEVEVLDSPGYASHRGMHYNIYEEYVRLLTSYDPRENIYRKIATIYKRYEERNW
jgi:hypothetical protein